MRIAKVVLVTVVSLNVTIISAVNELKAAQPAEATRVFCDDVKASVDYDVTVLPKDMEADKVYRLHGTKKGTRILFVLPENSFKVTIGEVIRRSRLAEDVSAILGLTKEKSLLPEPERKQCVIYTQEYKRSTIAVEVVDEGNSILLSRKLIVGPQEHLYLSADMSVTNIKQLTYDTTTNTVVEKEKPASFYFGINCQLGDIYTDYSKSEFHKNLSIKFLVKASSHPNESMGVGLAYSSTYADIFAASVWTQDDESVPGTKRGTTQSYIAGISFNISKGLEWLKK